MKLKNLLLATICLLGLTLVSCENSRNNNLAGTKWKGRNQLTDIYVAFTKNECTITITDYSEGIGTASYVTDGTSVTATVKTLSGDLKEYAEIEEMITATYDIKKGKMVARKKLYGDVYSIELSLYDGDIPVIEPKIPYPEIDFEAGTVNGKHYDNSIEKCWEVTSEMTVYGTISTTTTYEWGTEFSVVSTYEYMRSYYQTYKFSYTYKTADPTDEDSCKALNSDDEGTSGDDDDETTNAQIRFVKGVTNYPVLALGVKYEGELVAYYEFGNTTGTSEYFEIPAGMLNPVAYWEEEGDDAEGWYYWTEPYTYTFEAGKKYTYTLEGENVSIVEDGANNAPAKRVTPARKTTRVIIR